MILRNATALAVLCLLAASLAWAADEAAEPPLRDEPGFSESITIGENLEPVAEPLPAASRQSLKAREPIRTGLAPGGWTESDERPHTGDAFRSARGSSEDQTALAVRIAAGLTLLTILPALLVSLTAFLRTIIVLSMLRHAIGMPDTPPNTVLIGVALFLTLFTMSPVLHELNQGAFQPFMQGKLPMEAALEKGSQPLRSFMIRQTREQDLALMIELSKAPMPEDMNDISNVHLIPAFMLSELRTAFQIGFVIFLPFLLIDLIVSSILMGLGMMMMPPVSISLPVKILMFVLIDGWNLVLRALVGSFQ